MNLTKEQIAAAINAGTSLTDPESDLLDVFRKHAGGVLILRQLLIALGSGQLSLNNVLQDDGLTPPKPPTPPKTPKSPRLPRGAKKKKKKRKTRTSKKKKATKNKK